MSDESKPPNPGTPTPTPAPGPESSAERTEPTSKELFLGLVHSFQAAAMQQMGKIVNPFTQEIERDLPQARLSIDMLLMLQERTSGNLTPEESRFVAHVLRELQLNYVMELEEETKKGSAENAGSKGGTEPDSGS